MYKIFYTKRFEKSLKLCRKRGLDLEIIKEVIEILKTDGKLPEQ
jgi:mRNA interferase YafQ